MTRVKHESGAQFVFVLDLDKQCIHGTNYYDFQDSIFF